MSSQQKMATNQLVSLSNRPKGDEILNFLLQPEGQSKYFFHIEQYKNRDLANFVHLLSKVSVCENYGQRAKQLLEKLYTKCNVFLFNVLLQSVHAAIDNTRNVDIDVFTFVIDYFTVLKTSVELLDDGWKSLEKRLPELQYLVHRLLVLDVESGNRAAQELRSLRALLNDRRESSHEGVSHSVEFNLPQILDVNCKIPPVMYKNIEELLNFTVQDLENVLQSALRKERDLENLMHLISESYVNKNKNLKRLLNLCNRSGSCFSLKNVLQVICKAVDEGNEIDKQKIVMGYFIMIKAFAKLSDENLKVVQGIFPDLQNLTKKLMHLNVQGNDKILRELEKIERHCVGRKKTQDLHSGIRGSGDNFRKLSVVPKTSDIFNRDSAYIRKNVINEPYQSIEHYLDIHFRLMREDLLKSFRSCLSFGRSTLSRTDQHLDNGKLYTRVLVNYPPQYSLDGVLYKITVKAVSETNDWLNAKCLKPGSLICLSFDMFVTITFATIKERTVANEREVTLTVVLEDVGETLSRKMKYALVESDGYFEPYRHVLQLLKEIRKEDFPLADCIVYLDFKQCEAKYPTGSSIILKTNHLTEVKHDNTNLHKAFNVFDLCQWPSHEELGLDERQLEAFQLALRKKLALIQGPPGTGKTYLACKIVEAMLMNNAGRPIFICCASNRALDKFLNELFQYTKKIVRIGSQGRSDVLRPHVLGNLVHAQKLHRCYGERCVEQMDSLQRRALSILQDIYRDVPRTIRMPDDDSIRYAIITLSNEINELYADYIDCYKNYFCDGILNKIIDYDVKTKIIAGAGSSRSVLRNCLIEWLVLYKNDEDIYAKCEKTWEELFNDNNYEDMVKEVHNNGSAETDSEVNIWRIPIPNRFAMFYKWRKHFLGNLRVRIKEKKQRYLTIFRKIKKRVHRETVNILQNADIIGMTTCGAAKYHEYVLTAGPKVMIIEEAAEVFESHVISALVPSIEHLILIGDHEQLKPMTTTYEMSRDFQLNVSMFERLLKTGAPSVQLTKQYRMRTEIAELLVPFIYKALDSDQRVTYYGDIIGVASNVFFFNHMVPEDHQVILKISSNDFEAQFVSKLCEYLLSQGYKQSQITILVAYYGQLDIILRHLQFEINNLKVCTIDSYQGEENDIIIVSFVRSNNNKDIGFLGQSDRVCVSLSRARMGLYCIGNFDMLASKNKLWDNLVKRLNSQGMIGTAFPIRCRNHKDEILHLRQPEEFTDFLANGCGEKCGFLLDCGHLCSRSCHFGDSSHENYKCFSLCNKQISVNGKTLPCRKLCWEVCRKKKKCLVTLPCGHEIRCREVDAERLRATYKCDFECEKLLDCGHFIAVPCYRSKYVPILCTAAVQVVLDCGHKKMMMCNDLRQSESLGTCEELSVRTSPCGHIVSVPCSKIDDDDVALSSCEKSCDILLNCGHPCTGFCKTCFYLKIHEVCLYECDLNLSCGHHCKSWCGMPCPPCEEVCDMKCSHTACPNRCERPCVKCVQPCDRRCRHKTCNKKCWETCPPCGKPCDKMLKCGHSCIGMCNEPCPPLCRICDGKKLPSSSKPTIDLFVLMEDCGHVVEVGKMQMLIDNSIQSFKWPTCPHCSLKISRNVHFDMQLKKAKLIILQSIDPMDEFGKVKKLIDKVFPRHSTVPWKFSHLELSIRQIILTEKPAYSLLYTLRNYLNIIQKMKDIDRDITGKIPRLEVRLDAILKWITDHLRDVTYQQLEELHTQVEQLITFVREYVFS